EFVMSAKFLCSSIGKKQAMAITGLGWCGFVFAHMTGNLIYFLGPAAYNDYSESITGNKEFYYPIEIGLLTLLVLHILFAAAVVISNRRARPVGYAMGQGGSERPRRAPPRGRWLSPAPWCSFSSCFT